MKATAEDRYRNLVAGLLRLRARRPLTEGEEARVAARLDNYYGDMSSEEKDRVDRWWAQCKRAARGEAVAPC